VTYAAVTVPVSFSDRQLTATNGNEERRGDCGLLTGNLKILSAPTAATLAYAAEDEKLGKPADRKLVLVFDLGGRDVRRHVGRGQSDGSSESWPPQETHIWEWWTSFCRLVEWCVEKYFERHQIDLNVSGSRNVLSELYNECERDNECYGRAGEYQDICGSRRVL
jgi:hypothetical protein